MGGAVKGSEFAAGKLEIEGATWLALSLNKQGAHVSRVIIAPAGFRVKSDAPNVELAKFDSSVSTGEWAQHAHHRGRATNAQPDIATDLA